MSLLLFGIIKNPTLRPESFLFLKERLIILLGPKLGQLKLTLIITDIICKGYHQLHQINRKQDRPNIIRLKVNNLIILNNDISGKKPQKKHQVTDIKRILLKLGNGRRLQGYQPIHELLLLYGEVVVNFREYFLLEGEERFYLLTLGRA